MERYLEISQKSEKEILSEFKTSKEGLTEKEAKERLKIYGFNKIVAFKIDLLEIIKRNSLNFFNIFLFIAVLLSLMIKGPEIEAFLILFFLVVSIFVSIFQDYKANKLSEKLLSYFENYAFVKRNGKWQRINAKEIVPGDYVKVPTGYLIPADLRIFKAENAMVDESIITGESEPIIKNPRISADTTRIDSDDNILRESTNFHLHSYASHKRSSVVPENIALMGTTLIKGEIEGIVFATGKETYFGKVAKSTLEIPKETAYQKMMNDFAKNISFVSIIVALIVIFINLLKPGYPNIQELIIFTIVLAVAIVPEFLPTMTVLALGLAGNRLAKKGLIIKRLSSIEDLGAIEILCTDKTGTITTNELKLVRINSKNEEEFIKYFLADYYFTQEMTPYEKAILEYLNSIPLKQQKENSVEFGLSSMVSAYENFEFIEDIGFDPIKRIRKLIVKENGEEIEIIKGAPENVLEYISPRINTNISQINADITEKINQDKSLVNYWLKVFEEEDKNGYRTLGLGIKKQEEGKFLGIASFFDPLKDTAFSAIQLAKNLNIEVKILTGDALNVARKTALELGLINENDKVILGEDIRNLSEEEAEKIIKKTKVFARVLPEDKLKIIKILQKEKFVGFLGEGINDAPGLKIANVALAVDTAVDVVKQEADIILKEKDLKTIIDGIYEGRKTLENIGKYIKHTMSDNFGNLTSIAILTSILPFVPMTPLQVLLTNFLTDIPIIAFADDNVKIKEIRRPVKLSNIQLILLLLILGLIAGIVNITGYLLVKNESIGIIRTFIFFLTTMTGLAVCFSIRTKNWLIFSKPSKSFFIASMAGFIATIIFVFLPPFKSIFNFYSLNVKFILYSIFLIFVFIISTELAKIMFYKKFPNAI